MELNRRDENKNANYEFISGNPSQPWYQRQKAIICIGIAALVIIVVVIIVVATKSLRLPFPQKALPPLEWDDVCPVKADKCTSSFQGPPPLLIISLDGFRPDYLKRGLTPTIHKLSQCGVTAKFMYPVFPSKTFPNHFSQVTGLYPSSHGIIDNAMNDSGRFFKVGSAESMKSFWWQKEPIWITAEEQGKIAATFFWPGSEVKINGTLPTYYKIYNQNIPFEDRVDQIHKWLDFPEERRPDFMTLYFNEPDTAGHFHGINSDEVNEALKRVDEMIERLFSGLQQRNIIGCINIIIVSDHGMADLDCSQVIDLQDYTDLSNLHANLGALGRIRLRKKANTTEERVLSDLECKNSHMRVFKKEQLPVRMHYSSHPRIEPIVLEIDSGWNIKKIGHSSEWRCTGGLHGYDNYFPDMRAMFLAIGPSLKRNMVIEPFINTELYELMCELIGIPPNPNNGTRGSLHHILKEPLPLPPRLEPDSLVINEVEKNEDEYKIRVDSADCTCTQAHTQMDIDFSEKSNFHLPFGIPHSSEDNETLRLLYNNDYVLAYHTKHLIPLWTSFTLVPKMNTTVSKEVCWTGDARISVNETVRCSDYQEISTLNEEILQRPLYFPDFSNSSIRHEAAYVTNSVPKSVNHTYSLEAELIRLLRKWAQEDIHLNVMMGPAFDFFATGVKPSEEDFSKEHEKYGRLIVPTHLFVVVTSCGVKIDDIRNCSASDLQVHSFLLPNYPFPHNCQQPLVLIEKNKARVVDVEKLTGLSFFTELPVYDSIRLRTMMPHREVL